jgi:hypothetical protein
MNPDAVTKKIEELRTNESLKSVLPDLPVAIVLQEALNLFDWCSHDREIIIKKGLDWKLAEDLPIRAEALRRLETIWTSERFSSKDCQKEWKVALPLALQLRKDLVFHFRYVFSSKPDIYSKVQRISAGQGHADMIQDLIDLSVLGQMHQSDLEKLDFDLSMLDKARKMCFELKDLLARVNNVSRVSSEKQVQRNKAYYHLKESIEAIRKVGQYAFCKDEERLKGYFSAYTKRRNQKYRNKNT